MGQPATAASDRYALAVVAYELLTGRAPVRRRPATAQARQHVEDEPEPASEAEPDLPPAIDAAFARGLAKDPRDRPQTTVGLVEEIERALGGPVATERDAGHGAGRPARAAPPSPPVAPVVPSAGGRPRENAPSPVPRGRRRRARGATTPRRPPSAGRDRVRDRQEPGRPHRPPPFVAIGLAAALVIGILAIALANAGGGDPKDKQAGSTTPKATKTTPKANTQPPAAAQTPTTATPAAGDERRHGRREPVGAQRPRLRAHASAATTRPRSRS